jgi:atypical dual specificity phosphatase
MTLSSSNKNHLLDYNLTQITPYVYVSAEEPVRLTRQVLSNRINCIINVACELPHLVYPTHCGIQSFKYPIEDIPNFPAICYFDIIADRIAENIALNRRTLIYCRYGRSRSITFILAYLIKYHRLSLPAAFKLVQDQRQFALPNIGFWRQLQFYDLYHQEMNSSKISKRMKQLFR